MARGCDISRWQGTVDWSALAAQGILWAGIRASVGSYYTDRTFEFNYDGAKDVGILPFPYHVINPNNKVAEQLTRYRLSLDGRKPVMTVVDAELTGSVSNIILRRRHVWFIRDGMQDKDFGSQWIVYTNKGFANANLGEGYQSWKWRDSVVLWVASYGPNDGKIPPTPPYPRMPEQWEEHKAWQYTSRGKLNGIDGFVDLNTMGDTFYKNLRARSGIPEPGKTIIPVPDDEPTVLTPGLYRVV